MYKMYIKQLQKKAIRIINKNIYKKENSITKLTNTIIFY